VLSPSRAEAIRSILGGAHADFTISSSTHIGLGNMQADGSKQPGRDTDAASDTRAKHARLSPSSSRRSALTCRPPPRLRSPPSWPPPSFPLSYCIKRSKPLPRTHELATDRGCSNGASSAFSPRPQSDDGEPQRGPQSPAASSGRFLVRSGAAARCIEHTRMLAYSRMPCIQFH